MADDSDDDLPLRSHLKKRRALQNPPGTATRGKALRRRRGKEASHRPPSPGEPENRDEAEEREHDDAGDGDKPLAFSSPLKRSCEEAMELASGKCFVKLNNEQSTTTTTAIDTSTTTDTTLGTAYEENRGALKACNMKERSSSSFPSNGSTITYGDDDNLLLMHMSNDTKKKKQAFSISSASECGTGDVHNDNENHGDDRDGGRDADVDGEDDVPLIHISKNTMKKKKPGFLSESFRSGVADGDSKGNGNTAGNGDAHDDGNGSGVVSSDDAKPLIQTSKNADKQKQDSYVSRGSRNGMADAYDDDMALIHVSNGIKSRKQSSHVSSIKQVKMHANSLDPSVEYQRSANIVVDSEEEQEKEVEGHMNVHVDLSMEKKGVLVRADSEDGQGEKESRIDIHSSNVSIDRNTVALISADSEDKEEQEEVEEEQGSGMRVNASEVATEKQEIVMVVANSENEQEVKKEDPMKDVEEIEKEEVAALEEEKEESEEVEGDGDEELWEKEPGVQGEDGEEEEEEEEEDEGVAEKGGESAVAEEEEDGTGGRLQGRLKKKLVEEKEKEEERDEEDNVPLAKISCIKSRKGVSAKGNVSGVVTAIKEEDATNYDEDDNVPLSKQFGLKRKKDSNNDAMPKLGQVSKKEEDDDDIPLGKMLCLKKRKGASSKTRVNFISTPKSVLKTDRDEEEDDDYNQPLAKNEENQSIAKKHVSNRKILDTHKKKLKTPSRQRDSDSDGNKNGNANEEDDDGDCGVRMVKKIPVKKKSLGSKRKAESDIEKTKPRTPSKRTDSDEEDDEWEEDEGEEDEDDEDYDTSTVKKRPIMFKSKLNTSKHTKLCLKKKPKKMKDAPESGGVQKWTTLEHNGVIFPPPYQPHGVKMLYNGVPVELTSEQEEVATMFAVMHDTDYASKEKFVENFWNDWKNLLGKNHVIKGFEGCDFTPIYNWYVAEKEKKKQMTTEEKKAAKDEKMKQEEKYMWALVDGIKEKVGNFRVEPPGLFRGRGEHPKMGKLKRRICPEDIVINIGAEAPIPECPIPGRRWKEVRHDNTVTWLAYWNDPINLKEQKYVFLAASSNLKGQSDKEKYEKARLLKDYIDDIRRTYTENFTSSNLMARQIAVATYLIDQLALRAGNEKDDDEADTVGCCSLKVEHVTLCPPTSVEFDFLGKDSIRYYNKVEVIEPVYKAIGDFKKDKINGEDLFDKLDTNKLNTHLKNIMPQLTAKVFRTYNASITLDTLLVNTNGRLIPEKIAAYQKANKEVAILCNHQRSVSKTHGAQMEKLEGKLAELTELLDELEQELKLAVKGKPPKKDGDGNSKRNQNPEMLEKKIVQTRHKIERMKLDMLIKEDLKTVALGTSKINYMDPRITVAWCKRHEVPIERVFNRSLLAKFSWAMDVDMSFRF